MSSSSGSSPLFASAASSSSSAVDSSISSGGCVSKSGAFVVTDAVVAMVLVEAADVPSTVWTADESGWIRIRDPATGDVIRQWRLRSSSSSSSSSSSRRALSECSSSACLRLLLADDPPPPRRSSTNSSSKCNSSNSTRSNNNNFCGLLFRHIIHLLARKQGQSLQSIFFAGIENGRVSAETVLQGVAIVGAYGTKFKEFQTDAMQFAPSTMAQLRLLLARRDELRGTKWVYESCLASQRSVIHLRGKKLTDASAVLLDALDDMHAAGAAGTGHKINIIDIRDNFLTDSGAVHIKMILKREWSPVTQVLIDGNPDLDAATQREIGELAEAKDKKLLAWAQFQQMVAEAKVEDGRSPVRTAAAYRRSVSPESVVMSPSRLAQREEPPDVFEERQVSPMQKRFMKRFG